MAKLTDYKTPTGATGNLLNPSDWLSLIVGAGVLFITVGVGQHVAKLVSNKVPDTSISQPWPPAAPPVANDDIQKITL